MRRIRLLLLPCLSGLLLATSALAESLTLGNGEWPPYFSASLPGQGSFSRIVEEALTQEGMRVKYVFQPWKRSLELTRAGELDGSMGWLDTPERQRAFIVSVPILNTEWVVFHRAGHPVNATTDPDTLAKLRWGATLGYDYGEQLNSLFRRRGVHVEYTPRDEQNLAKLATGRIDAFAMEREVGLMMLAQSPYRRAIDYDATPVFSRPLHVMFSRSRPDSYEWAAKLARGIEKLRANGRLARIIEEGRNPMRSAEQTMPPAQPSPRR
ncbi:substrate-binding periplasmic protein [Chitiniphilus eburneus]|nr:transporter substrate-binding domain-containing protein [Chitiniphilus eburneus]